MLLFVDFQNKPPSGQILMMPVCVYNYIVSTNARKTSAGSLLANDTRSLCYSIHFYTNICDLISVVTHMCCDIKLQIVKTPIKAKLSRRYHQITHANVHCTKLQYKPKSFSITKNL